MLKLCFTFLFALPQICGAIYGRVTAPSERPEILHASAVAIFKKQNSKKQNNKDRLSFHCSGVIVGPQTVLTAAHCFEDENFRLAIRHGQRWINAIAVKLNKDFRRQTIDQDFFGGEQEVILSDDFALIELDYSFPSKNIAPMATDDSLIDETSTIIMTGFGITGGIFDTEAGEDFRASIPRQPTEVTTERININNGATGICPGDSGGASWIVLEDGSHQLAGINSQGDCRFFSKIERMSLGRIQRAEFLVVETKRQPS